ncbi:MAG: peptidylprolyl isomerase [Bacteroidales bacterium]|nr:peptidylprolyl isomerase [Bacteroidales bacterium]MBN2763395.1 peptidylprolyl isomerase [Bacteroidales bacterium]
MRKIVFFFTAFCFMQTLLYGQDEILMTIGNEKVTKAEFERIYHKNNSSLVYENKSPKEYLDLFINFKLKVLEAKAQGYDTMSAFVKELKGYRDQLAKPYLQDKEKIQQMLDEAYDRTVNEVNASHILIRLNPNASPADTAKAYNKAMALRDSILAGKAFEDIAVAYSEDNSAVRNKGELGWFAAFRMVYPFENAAYNTPVGQISMPVRTRYGYHLIRNNGFRKSPGDILLSHIMLRVQPDADSATRQEAVETINKCYELLKQGEDFAALATKYSNDQASARYGGKLRWISSGELPVDIEEIVFALTDSGQFTEPMKSQFGYHIFMLRDKQPLKSFEELKSYLEGKMANDDRQKSTDLMYIQKLKDEYGFTEYPENLDELIGMVDSSLYDGNWDPATAGPMIDPVFSIGDKDYSQLDFGNYIIQIKRYSKREPVETICRRRYNDFVNEKILDYETGKLDKKYPEFGYLMEEYHDGILLFNITDDKVWSKAVKDTAGLEKFYKKHKKQYKWQTRADISRYLTSDSSLVPNIVLYAPQRAAKGWSARDFNALVCGQDTLACVEVEDQKLEKGSDKNLDSMEWEKGTIKTYTEKGKNGVLYINKILKPQLKKLNESRGLVTADYQNELEKQWIQELRGKYPVSINEEVFKTIK